MAPKFVAPYRMSGKRGKNDAAAICEAVQRPSMRFVPLKSIEQQGQLMVHRARQSFVEQRTATLNRIRGLLTEMAIVLPLKAATALASLPAWGTTVIGDLVALKSAPGRNNTISRWAVQLAERSGYWRAVVAIAAKNARMAWAVLSRGERFVLPA